MNKPFKIIRRRSSSIRKIPRPLTTEPTPTRVLGKYDDAIKDYDEALKLDAENAKIYANRGVIRARQGKTEDAQQRLSEKLSS